MPTPIDRAMNSRNMFLGFAGLVTAVAAWGIWGGDMFPQAADPKGEPENWTEEDMKRWLDSVSGQSQRHRFSTVLTLRKRNLMAGSTATREELLARVKANMRAPRV
ncbi:hypothetical protein LTR35_016749 [Friedmanniomyces endolithicus]|uniref:STE24 endopeptidase n=1 Tax=Friedmanniomyces endolithicus TaxID=329885 RepID=A0AAN6J0L7_9PEZI|nr:hypothetical protein LTR35_016749 [Friedmanniomyces endolithicus]KAK0294700.1 hypothetical protein LTS00_006901 [Friedmanniomyces endolithicus]KAK0303258.1 hypothetical protein LTR82_017600 [Friedmanniomyces endolithicus]KAK1009692.1 hypothetical protein LTR54_005488 [Friedmanniomyces endolithicus]